MTRKNRRNQETVSPEILEKLSQALKSQPDEVPPALIGERVRAISRMKKIAWDPWLQMASGVVVAVVLWFLFGAIVQPGVSLSWKADVDQTSSFLVFRSEVGKDQFKLVAEISAIPGQSEYVYRETQYLPGISYQYQVEGVGATGIILNSVLTRVDSSSLLPIYFLLMGLSVATSYALVFVIGYLIQLSRLNRAVMMA